MPLGTCTVSRSSAANRAWLNNVFLDFLAREPPAVVPHFAANLAALDHGDERRLANPQDFAGLGGVYGIVLDAPRQMFFDFSKFHAYHGPYSKLG